MRVIRKLVAMGLLLAISACTDPPAEPARPPSTAKQTYAVLTDKQLLLVTGDTVTFAVDGDFPPGFASLAWTGDGRYVVVASGADNQKRKLSIMDSRNGSVRTISCPECQDPVTLPGGRVVLADPQHGLSILDAAGGTLSRIPSQVRFYSLGLRVLDASADTIVVAGADADMVAPTGGPEDLYAVKLSGETKPLGSTESNAPVEARIGPGGKLALIVGFHAGACAEGSVVQVRPGGARLDPPVVPLPEAERFGTTMGPYAAYHDVWWAPDGRLHAIASVWACTETGGATVPEDPPVVAAALDGGRWAVLPDPPTSHAVVKKWRDGTLTVVRDGTAVKIGENTVDLALKPD